ncbi:MAG: Holliday junction branch migration protein RuvA [Bacteroidia bacterium]|nr:Holliday junction branch migration protein RuvA [Bacteroidia bacterium]
MIAYIQGNLSEKTPSYIIVDCGGVGYLIKISLYTYNQIQNKTQVKIHTFLQIKEDAHTLYGFAELKEKSIFELLISVSGVGANTALMMLSAMSPAEIGEAIRLQKTNLLKAIKGIGAKTAERIILELRDKIPADIGGVEVKEAVISSSAEDTLRKEAMAALVNMGFNKALVETKINALVKEHGSSISLSELIRLTMKN